MHIILSLCEGIINVNKRVEYKVGVLYSWLLIIYINKPSVL